MTLLLCGVVSCSVKNPVLIESRESKTIDDKAVFNKISWTQNKFQDVWLMKQSHDGINAAQEKWNVLEIIVDKKQKPYKVSFRQLKDGKESEYRASCFLCHANGPRAIRPVEQSAAAPLSVADKIQINLMNLRIKTYGRMELDRSNFLLDGKKRKSPVAFGMDRDWTELKVKTCLQCHSDSGFLSRGFLKSQQVMTIDHLTRTGEMPPWPYKLSEKEKLELQSFIINSK